MLRPQARFSQKLMPLNASEPELPAFDDAPLAWNEIARLLAEG